jgi:hypothetical protein
MFPDWWVGGAGHYGIGGHQATWGIFDTQVGNTAGRGVDCVDKFSKPRH